MKFTPVTVRRRALDGLLAAFLVALGLLVLVGLLPRRESLSSSADPAPDYEAALARWRRLLAAEAGAVNPANGSRLLGHGRRTQRVHILVHGLTNSPRQWLALGEQLHAQGDTVLIPRLPHHGLFVHDVAVLRALTPGDLCAYADTAVDIAAGLGEEIVVSGISAGAVVAAWMAQQRPEVGRALLLAPFFGLYGLPRSLNGWLVNALSRLPNFSLQRPGERERAWAYRGESTRGAAAFLVMGQALLRQTRAGRRPAGEINVLTTAVDRVADNEATARMIAYWRRNGAAIRTFQFAAALDIPHNAVDPSADPLKRERVHAQMLRILDEP